MNIRPMIDSTLLKADASHQEIVNICREACEFGFAAVCVNPVRVPLAVKTISDYPVAVCTVAAFPLGAVNPQEKAAEVERALVLGAAEVDLVINIGAVKDGDYQKVTDEVNLAVRKIENAKGRLKIIVETALLTRDELRRVCDIARGEGADFIKTSTGFSSRGASVEDIKLIREFVKDNLKIKASGGIRNYDFACELIKAGANRLGVSNAASLIAERLHE